MSSDNTTVTFTSGQVAWIEHLEQVAQQKMDQATAQGQTASGVWNAMYDYILSVMQAEGIGGAQAYWFQEAGAINSGNLSNPAGYFVRDITALGFGVPLSDPKIQAISNTIGANIFSTIQENIDANTGTSSLIFSQQLADDINTAINEYHLPIGSWGGSFYFWNFQYQSGSGVTIGEEIESDPTQKQIFIANTAQAMANTIEQFGISTLESSQDSRDAFEKGFENLAFGGVQSAVIGYDLLKQLATDVGETTAQQFMQWMGPLMPILVAAGGESTTAGSGLDFLFGGQGLSGIANDTLIGGSGNDAFVFALPSSGSATETISDASGNGQVDVLTNAGAVSQLGGTAAQPLAAVAGQADTWTDGQGTTYKFDSTTDDLTITDGLLGSGNQIVIDNFELGAATETVAQGGNGNGYLGFYLADGISLTAGANAGFDPPAPNFTAGTSQSYTVWVNAPSTSAQTVTLTLSGVPASDFGIATGTGVVALGSNGTFTVTIAAGQTSAAFTLVNTGDVGKTATMTLSASMTNPGDSSGQAITSETLTQNYVETSPDPFTNSSTSTVSGVAKTEASTGFNYTNYQGGTTAGQSEQMVLSGGDNYVVEGGENDFISEAANSNNIILGSSASSNDILLNGATTVDQAIALTGTDTTASGQRGDVVATGAGNDTIIGGTGNSLYLVGAGANVIYTGAGNDTVWGGFYSPDGVGSYASQFNWSASVDNTVPITVTEGTHTVSYYQVSTLNESGVGGAVDTVNAGIASGSDTVVAGNGTDYIALPDGANYVLGGSGHDSIWDGSGNNTIFGGAGTCAG